QLIAISKEGFNDVYARVGVKLTDEHLAGEATYNDELAGVADDMAAQGVAVMDDGALCVFVDGYNAPLLIRKSDGRRRSDPPDTAAPRHGGDEPRAERSIVVPDVRPHAHFMQVFGAARKAGYLPDAVVSEHVGYGMVLDTDNKPLKSRYA